MTATATLRLPPELRPGLFRSDDPLFQRLLAASLLLAGAASLGIARVEPLQQVGEVELPRVVRELILPLPVPADPVRLPVPGSAIISCGPAPTRAARPTPPAAPSPSAPIEGLGLLGHLGGEGALGGLLDPGDATQLSISKALEGARPTNLAAPIGTFRGAEGGETVQVAIPGSGGVPPVTLRPKRDAAPAAPSVILAPPLIPGKKLTAEAVTRQLRTMLPAFQRCYEKAVTRDHSLHGRMLVGFTIAPGGRVSEVEIEESELGGSVDACVRTLVRSLRFPVQTSEEIPVSYPLIFAPAG